MKKYLILTLFIFAVTFAFAQVEEEEDAEYKQSSGDKSLELQFDPGAIFNASNNNNVLSNGIGIRFRMFSQKSFPFRVNLNISYLNSNTITQEEDVTQNLLELKDKSSNLLISLRPGMEKHFNGTKRLSPYVGGEVIFSYRKSVLKSEYQNAQDVFVIKTQNNGTGDGLTLGLGALAGFDYYIAKKLYLGVELGYNFSYFMPSKTKISDSAPNTTDIESKLNKTNSFVIEPQSLGVLRLGFLF